MKMKWFHGMFSIDEFRMSSLVMIMVAVVAVILITYCVTGNVDQTLISFAETLVYSVAGVNVVNGVTTVLDKRKELMNSATESATTTTNVSTTITDSSNDADVTYGANEEDENESVMPKI